MDHDAEQASHAPAVELAFMRKFNIGVFIGSGVLFAIIFVGYGATKTGTERTIPVHTTVDYSAMVATLAQQRWDWEMTNYPEYATYVGDGTPPATLTDISVAGAAARAVELQAFMSLLQQVNASAVVEEDAITLSMLINDVNAELQGYNYKQYLLVMNQLEGPQLDLPNFPNYMNLQTNVSYAAYVNWLSLIPAQLNAYGVLLQEAVKANILYPNVILGAVANQIEGLCHPAPGSVSAFYAPIQSLETSASPNDQALAAQARNIIQNQISPAYCNLGSIWTSTYLPATTNVPIGAIDRFGAPYYQFMIQRETTLNLSATTIHNLGLSEVNRILGEMATAKASMPAPANSYNLTQLNDYMRAAPQFALPDQTTYLQVTRDICKRADALLPSLFNWLPRCPYGVLPLDPVSAPTAPAAYYMGPNQICSRAGYYMVNTYDLPSRPTYTMESTALHETVPGHHLQIALALELTSLPLFRRNAGITAFIEGWALYAETLGPQLGMYTDPFSMYGHLGDEMLRACRLVVDSGMHALGWTRQQSIDFMSQNSPLSLQDIRSEVDRYIAWPGQALAYKTGALTIQQLKTAAQQALGANFDVRQFHTAVLNHGAIPLNVLADVVTAELGFTTEVTFDV